MRDLISPCWGDSAWSLLYLITLRKYLSVSTTFIRCSFKKSMKCTVVESSKWISQWPRHSINVVYDKPVLSFLIPCCVLQEAEGLVSQKIHPQTIVTGWRKACTAARGALVKSCLDHGWVRPWLQWLYDIIWPHFFTPSIRGKLSIKISILPWLFLVLVYWTCIFVRVVCCYRFDLHIIL